MVWFGMVWYGSDCSGPTIPYHSQGRSKNGKGRNTDSETAERTQSASSNSRPRRDLGTPSPFRFTVSATTTMYVDGTHRTPAHHGTPRRASIGGPSSSGSPVPFSHPPPALQPRQRRKCIKCKNEHRNRKEYLSGMKPEINPHPPSLFLSLHLRRYSALPLTLSIDKARPSRPEDRSLAT